MAVKYLSSKEATQAACTVTPLETKLRYALTTLQAKEKELSSLKIKFEKVKIELSAVVSEKNNLEEDYQHLLDQVSSLNPVK